MAKNIGVSNFTIPLINETIKLLGDRKVVVNQCEIHAYMQNRPIVIPSSGKKDRIISSYEARNIELSDTEMVRLRGLEKGMRLVNGDWCPVWDF